MAPGVHKSLQVVLWHEFEDVLEATTMVHESPFVASHQRSIAGQTPCKTDRNLVFESSSIQITPPRPSLSFPVTPDSLRVATQVKKSGCRSYLDLNMWVRSSDEVSKSAFRAS